MSSENRMLLRICGVLLMAASVFLCVISPPAITLYQNNGFFWWGAVPGGLFGLGFLAIVLPIGFPPESTRTNDDDWWNQG